MKSSVGLRHVYYHDINYLILATVLTRISCMFCWYFIMVLWYVGLHSKYSLFLVLGISLPLPSTGSTFNPHRNSCISIIGVPHLCLFVFSHADVFSLLSGLRTSSVEVTRQKITLCSLSFSVAFTCDTVCRYIWLGNSCLCFPLAQQKRGHFCCPQWNVCELFVSMNLGYFFMLKNVIGSFLLLFFS